MKVQLRLRYEMNRQLRRDSGISLVDYDVLVALTSESTGTMALSDLAIRIGAERSRVSHQTRRMAARRWVTLHPRPRAPSPKQDVAVPSMGCRTTRP